MRDDTLVSKQSLDTTLNQLGEHGSDSFVNTLLEAEPDLGGFLTHNATLVAGKLALAGAPQPVIEGVHSDLLAACALVYWAVRQGSYEIWHGTALGDRLLALQPTPETTSPEQAAGVAQDEEEPEECDAPGRHIVVLLEVTAGRKTELIRTLNKLTGQTVRQVRQLLNHTPVALFRDITHEVALDLQAQLEQAGGRAVVLPETTPQEATGPEDTDR
jgi:ribosomal protein L7/L12